MSFGEQTYHAGETMSPYYSYVIKTCAVMVAAPAITFGGPAQQLAALIYSGQSNPGDMFKSAGAWFSLGEKNLEAAGKLGAQVDSINDDNWSGDDADAFKGSASGVNAQLTQLAVTSFLIGAQLMALGVMLSVYWCFLLVCVYVLMSFMVAFIAASWSGAGAAAVRVSARVGSTAMLVQAKSWETMMKPIMITTTALTATLTVFTWGFQAGAGNQANPLEIALGSITNMLEGFATYWVNEKTMPGGDYMKGMVFENLLQASSVFAPTYDGGNPFDSENWNAGGWGGGGAGFGVADGVGNLWESFAPDLFTNPEEIEWT